MMIYVINSAIQRFDPEILLPIYGKTYMSSLRCDILCSVLAQQHKISVCEFVMWVPILSRVMGGVNSVLIYFQPSWHWCWPQIMSGCDHQ